jgi:hypothetical protein
MAQIICVCLSIPFQYPLGYILWPEAKLSNETANPQIHPGIISRCYP